ncbi:MAG: HemY protein [Halieaceae bacterium]
MRRLLIIAVLTLMAAVGLVALIEYDPGYVLVSYGHTTLETSVWIGLMLLVCAFLIFYYSIRAWKRLLASKGWVGSLFSGRSSQRSQRRTASGMINYIEGNWSKARRQLLAGARNSDAPLLNYLIAAKASDKMGDIEQAQNYLRMAESTEGDALIAIELTQAEIQLDRGQLEDALATLQRVRKNAAKHPHVLYLLSQVFLRLKDWQSLGELLPELRKRKVLDAARIDELQLTVNRDILRVAASTGGDAERRDKLQKAWKSLPDAMRKDGVAVADYASYLIAADGDEEAEKVLLKQLKKNWDDALIRLYGVVQGANVAKQLTIAEAWLRERPNNGELLLCAGRLSLRNELWGKARDYFQISHKILQTPETSAELGRLLARLGEHQKSGEHFQRGLMLSQNKLPDLPMPQRRTKLG